METRRSYRPPPAATQTAVGIGPVELPTAAVVRKGRAREQQDLFAAVDDTANLRAAVVENAAAERTGERAENSVLFSASVFNAAPSPAVPAMRPKADSSTGTFDLLALAKASGSSLEYKPLTLSEPPMGAFVQDVPMAAFARAPKHTGLFIAGGVAATFMLGIIGIATFAGGADEPVAAKHVAAAQATVVESAKVTVGRDEAPTTAVATAVAGKSHKSASGMGFASTGRSTSTSAPVTPKKPVVKSSDPCHCKGNLACTIRCSATGH